MSRQDSKPPANITAIRESVSMKAFKVQVDGPKYMEMKQVGHPRVSVTTWVGEGGFSAD